MNTHVDIAVFKIFFLGRFTDDVRRYVGEGVHQKQTYIVGNFNGGSVNLRTEAGAEGVKNAKLTQKSYVNGPIWRLSNNIAMI